MIWFWLNVPLMLLFLGCWAGIPAWHTLASWDAELKAKHKEIAARAAEPVFVPEQQVSDLYAAGNKRLAGGSRLRPGAEGPLVPGVAKRGIDG